MKIKRWQGATIYNFYKTSGTRAASYTPTATADTNGVEGELSFDSSYVYVKTAAGWKRAALSTF